MEHLKLHKTTSDAPREIGEIQYWNNHLLGRGGYSNVFLGQMKNMSGFHVAVKRIRESMDTISEEDKVKLRVEGNIMKQLQHPNVVKLIAFAENELFM